MNCGGGVGGFIATRDEERYVREYNGFLVSITETARARRVRLRPRQRAPDLLRHAREGQGLDRQLRLSLGDRQCRLYVAAGAARLPRDRRADHQPIALRGEARWPRSRASRSPFPAASSRNSSSISPAPAKPCATSTRRCASSRIFGGKDLSAEFPALGQSALYCVTEVHTATISNDWPRRSHRR